MAGAGGQGGPGLAPPPQESQQPQGLPHGAPQGPPGLNPPPGPPQHPFGGYPAGPGGVNGRQIPPNPYADGRENPVRFTSFGISNGWQLPRLGCASSCFPDVLRPALNALLLTIRRRLRSPGCAAAHCLAWTWKAQARSWSSWSPHSSTELGRALPRISPGSTPHSPSRTAP